MCLNRRWFGLWHWPYNKTKTRWKIVDFAGGLHLQSIYFRHLWEIDKVYACVNRGREGFERDTGFHVFVEKPKKCYSWEAIIEVEVGGFIASGSWAGYGIKTEMWRAAKAVKVYNSSGVDITDAYKKKERKCV